jgi:hypothetical protein
MHLLFYGTFVALLIMGFDWRILLGIFGFKTLLQYVVFVPAARKLESTRPLVMLPLLDMVFVFYNVFVGVRSIFIKPEKWS